jgi:transcription initiation factor TFIIIB Brf1 subunit/transcription initiation factor TFIIB
MSRADLDLARPALREACDRCARESRSIEWVATACLCAECRDDLKTRSLTMFAVDVERWHRRPLNAARVFEVSHAA